MNKIQTGKVEVDQSVRIEELRRDTILAVANKQFQYAVRFPAHLKRQLYELFRLRGMRKKFGPWVFAAAAAQLLEKSNVRVSDVVIDIEYPGYERDILTIIKNIHSDIYVSFTTVGKNSPAHEKAYFALKGKKAVEATLHYSDFRAWIEAKQKDWRTVTPRVYEDSQSNQSAN
jgi:hypothetical protein